LNVFEEKPCNLWRRILIEFEKIFLIIGIFGKSWEKLENFGENLAKFSDDSVENKKVNLVENLKENFH
jgi:hypothetical protein